MTATSRPDEREPEHPEGDPIPGEGDPVATGAKGGGEWPSPSTPPDDAAPGSDPARAAELRRERRDSVGEDVDPNAPG